MFDILPNFLTTLTILLPIYASHKALSATTSSQIPLHQQPALLTPWLTYFLILSLLHLLESYLFLLTWLPFYAYARLFAHIYLLLPGQNRGATYIYKQHVAPFLTRHETQIETFIAQAHTQLRVLGLGRIEQVVEVVKTKALGWPATPERNWAAEAARGPPSSNNYVASLLGRFSVPFATGSGDYAQFPPSIVGGGGSSSGGGGGASAVAGFLGIALAQASSLASAPSGSVAGSRARGGNESGMNEALIPPHLVGDRERLGYIASRREQLRTLLGAFEREEQGIHASGPDGGGDGLGGNGNGNGNGQGMGRSKSEAEFETIVAGGDESNASPSKNTAGVGGGGWGSWFGRRGIGGGDGGGGKGAKEN